MPRMTAEQLERLYERAARYGLSIDDITTRRVKRGVVKFFMDFRGRGMGESISRCIFRHECKVAEDGHVYDNKCHIVGQH
jgi:hypothetical protein